MSSNFQSSIHFLLNKLGYKEISHTSTIVRDALRRSFAKFGEGHVANLFFDHMSEIYGLREDQYLVRFELVEKSLSSLFGSSVNILFAILKEELLAVSDVKSDDYDTGDAVSDLHRILYHIAEDKVLRFVEELPSHEHITLLYGDKSSKDKVINAYLGSEHYHDVPKAILYANSTRFRQPNYRVDGIAYSELEVESKEEKRQQRKFSLEKLAIKINEIHGRNKTQLPTRIVGEGDNWFIDNGYLNELLDLEKALGRKVKDRMCYLCVYDSSRITEEQLESLASCHGFIVADNPMVIYQSSN